MFKNYLKIALRFLKQNKVFAGINALGLSIALAASFIILLFIINELSYNRLHKNRKYVFRVLNFYQDFKITQTGTPYILATALKEEFIDVPNPVATDSEIFDIFTIPLIYGSSQQNLLEDQNSIIFSRELSEKLFPDQNPIGKEIIGLANNEEHLFVVKGVFENIPINSTFRAR